ncbi:polyprenyl synthetase family protein [Candidatus Daviesbacteria bacterium]|nr:polyprenyl synthetase family protein [Candidatus Daviesbacteria bacterium]
MDDQIILEVDDQGNFLGYIPKEAGHKGLGKRHLAITVLLFNKSGQVLLQKRKHKIFNDIWDLTGATHPLHLSNGSDETVEDATKRCLKREYGLDNNIVLKNLGSFPYFAKYNKTCENEYCALLVGEYDGPLQLNPEVGYDYKWMDKNEFLKDISQNPSQYSPWAVESVKLLEQNGLSSSFQSYLKSTAKEVNIELDNFLKNWLAEVKLKSPKLTALHKSFIQSCQGGKRVRAALVKLGYELAGGKDTDQILKPALAFEVFQTAILAHDDIIDQSPIRRGQPSLYQALGGNHYGISQTICLGDIGFFLALRLIAESCFPDQVKNLALQSFIQSTIDTALGEMLDVELPTTKGEKTEKDALTIFYLKAAKYTITGPMEVGARLAGVDGKLVTDLNSFGDKLGMAFQIQDDILGVFGDEKTIGKSVLSDSQEGKITLLSVYALKHATNKQRAILKKYYGQSKIGPKELEEIKKVFIDSGALSYSQKKAESLLNKAKKVVGKMDISPSQQKMLMELADFITQRNY